MHLIFVLVAALAVSFSSHAATVSTVPPAAAATPSGAAATTPSGAANSTAPAAATTAASAAATTTQATPCSTHVCSTGFVCQVNMNNHAICVPSPGSFYWMAWILANLND